MVKLILDACCGGRMMWFNKQHPRATYIDIEPRPKGICPERPCFHVEPDFVMDFRDLTFADKSFKLILWDPPHLTNLSKSSRMHKKYGSLNKETWQYDLTRGFSELWRVLDDFGVLVFKWNETKISLKQVLACFPEQPLFGHPTSKNGKTKWLCFMKIPSQVRP